MALNPTSMVSAFLQLATKFPTSSAEVAKKWSQLYFNYAKQAQALSSLPVFTGLEQPLMEQTLALALAIPNPTPVAVSTAWSLGVTTFWNLPPVTFTGIQTGVVLQAATASAIILPAMTALLANPLNTAQVSAAGMATILDGATRTVTVSLIPPPGTTAPLL